MLDAARQARRHDRGDRQDRARPHRLRAGRGAGAAQLRAARLHAVSEVDLHVDQPPGLPRHPERPAAEERRHRQHRRHRHQGRLARRHQPHVHRRRRLDRGQAPGPDHLRRDVEGDRQGQARRPPRRHRQRDPAFAESQGFSIVREFCGHGIGARFHEDPQVLHYGKPGTLDELKPGMTFTIEPMINAGKRDIREAGDGWTIVTRDRSLSAQWEHTVLVTDDRLRSDDALGRLAAAAGLRRRRAEARRRVNTRDPIVAPAAPASRGEAAPAPRAPAELRARFRDAKAERLARFLAARPTARAALRLVRALAGDVDVTLLELWRDAGMPADAALVAVGGYGRGELFPYSDVDVLVLLPSPRPPTTRRAAPRPSASSPRCWDAGLEIGSSVRTVDECVAMALVRRHRADGAARSALPVRRAQGVQGVRAAPPRRRWTPRRSCARRRSRCASATRSTRTRPTRSSPTARRARAACATCRP